MDIVRVVLKNLRFHPYKASQLYGCFLNFEISHVQNKKYGWIFLKRQKKLQGSDPLKIQGVPQDVPQDKLDAQIVDMIRKDNKISTEKIAIALGVSSKTIKRHIKEMYNVSYIGRGFSGHWENKDDE